MRAQLFSLVCVTALVTGCNPLAFDDIKKSAPTVVLSAPGSYPVTGFGKKLASYGGTLADDEVWRLVVTAGPGSPARIYDTWSQGALHLSNALTSICDKPTNEGCSDLLGAAVTGFPSWDPPASPTAAGEMCLVMTSNEPVPDMAATFYGKTYVRCESAGGNFVDAKTPTLAETDRFGEAAVGLGPSTFDGAHAVIGAPGRDQLYVLKNDITSEQGTEILGPLDAFSGLAGVGVQLAAHTEEGEPAWIAATANEGDMKRVVLFTATGTPAAQTLEVRACVNNTDPGFGGALAMGYIDDDRVVDLVIGTTVDANGRVEAVKVLLGKDLPTTTNGTDCPADEWAATVFTCPNVDGTGVDCDGSSFGSAVAIGDINADGFGDLLVGAPFAAVDGTGSAGAVFVFPGNADGTSEDGVVVLRSSSPEDGARLGFSVATIRGVDRDEPVAGAPGNDSVNIFLCSGLDGDTPALGKRCQPPESM